MNSNLIEWLLEGDVSIQYQVYRDLLSEIREDLRERIVTEGWGKAFLDCQNPDGHWGLSYYQPKWTSTHYTLLDLRNLCFPQDHPEIRKILTKIAAEEKGRDGGINPSRTVGQSDVCLNGMFLNFASYFKSDEGGLRSVVDHILDQRMRDGGFNCRLNRSGAVHSSLHSTLSVAEGIREYHVNGYQYRLEELLDAEKTSIEFLLLHRLYLSDSTGEVIHPDFLRLAYPGRWRYDILRALDYLRRTGLTGENRLEPALQQLVAKQKKPGWWTSVKHTGKTYFHMEPSGQPSRWNTLRALRVLNHFNIRAL